MNDVVLALREDGQVCRPVAELDVAVTVWRAAIRQRARSEGIRVRTFLIDVTPPAQAGDRPIGAELGGDEPGGAHLPMVCAVRTDIAPDAPESRTGPLWWRRVEGLPVPPATWRAALRRTARRNNITIRTFLIPPTCDDEEDGPAGQLVYALWIDLFPHLPGPSRTDRAARVPAAAGRGAR